MKELKRFDVLSVGKVFGAFGLILSILQMVFLKVFYAIDPVTSMQYGFNGSLAFGDMLLGIIVATIAYFIGGMLSALIYNLVVKHTGGIMIKLDDAKVKAKKKKKK